MPLGVRSERHSHNLTEKVGIARMGIKRICKLDTGWEIKSFDHVGVTISEEEAANVLCDAITAGDWLPAAELGQVPEILMAHGRISPTILEDGNTDEYRWIARTDWAYYCTFRAAPASGRNQTLVFDGIDTIADIFVNGVRVARCESMYMPVRVDVGPVLKDENQLLVYIHSPFKMIEHLRNTMPTEWKGEIDPRARLRKTCIGFGDYLGCKSEFVPIGIFAEVRLEDWEAQIAECRIDSHLSLHLDKAEIETEITALGESADMMNLKLIAPGGEAVAGYAVPLVKEAGAFRGKKAIKIENPVLWWPVRYGKQSLYRLSVALTDSTGAILDQCERNIGLRDIRMVGDFKFEINHAPIRLWGANFAPPYGFTLREQWDRESRILELAYAGNMNIMRIWGPSKPYSERLYDMADQLGILIWQDFPIEGFGQLPDDDAFNSLVLEEAAQMVKRLRHHPSILLWSGSNETELTSEWRNCPNRRGMDLLKYGLRQICLEHDKRRPYTPTCPFGGEFANDPRCGDTHGGNCIVSFITGEDYPVLVTETIKTFPPALKSLQRFIPADELWPAGYEDRRTWPKALAEMPQDPMPDPMPPGWMRRGTNYMKRKTGPIEQYYDAHDAESLVYRIAAATAQGYRELIGRCRQGGAWHQAPYGRKNNGCLLWKMNDTWPQIYCALIDYYLEPTMPYYMAKRMYSPFLLRLEVEGAARVWGVNDTGEDVAGELELICFDPYQNTITARKTMPALVRGGESLVLGSFDAFGPIRRENILYARLLAPSGEVLGTDTAFLNIERDILFPRANLRLALEGDILSVSTDCFARCVELSGDADGDAFGWFFEDNYFDMMPFETRRIRISGRHRQGVITAKAFYSPHAATIHWK